MTTDIESLTKGMRPANRRSPLYDHEATIKALHMQGYSFRQIAEVLRDLGVDTHQNNVSGWLKRQQVCLAELAPSTPMPAPPATSLVQANQQLGALDKLIGTCQADTPGFTPRQR
jgi:hypothetical protein